MESLKKGDVFRLQSPDGTHDPFINPEQFSIAKTDARMLTDEETAKFNEGKVVPGNVIVQSLQISFVESFTPKIQPLKLEIEAAK